MHFYSIIRESQIGRENSHSRSAEGFDQKECQSALTSIVISSEEYIHFHDSDAFVMASFVESVLVGALAKGINVCVQSLYSWVEGGFSPNMICIYCRDLR